MHLMKLLMSETIDLLSQNVLGCFVVCSENHLASLEILEANSKLRTKFIIIVYPKSHITHRGKVYFYY